MNCCIWFYYVHQGSEILEMNVQKHSWRESFYLRLRGILTNVLETLETKFIYKKHKILLLSLTSNANEVILLENTTFIL